MPKSEGRRVQASHSRWRTYHAQSRHNGWDEYAQVRAPRSRRTSQNLKGSCTNAHLRLFGEEGRSYTYDSRATGYGRGEGCVSVVLKPLADAERDGDVVRAVIRNTGANQDGKTSGITFPSCDAQTLLMKSVYESAGIDPLETVYVEAHGTGTAAGDPVEAEAIARVLGAKRESDHPLYVGSVKSNIGHLEAASGLAAMVKVIWALEEGIIPPNINFETPNKDIPMEEWKLKAGCGKINWSKTRAKLEQVPTAITPWPNSRIRQASISNFGFGGQFMSHMSIERS